MKLKRYRNDGGDLQIWVGATDLKNTGEFEFYDGEPIRFSIPWARKQHDNKKTKKQGCKFSIHLVTGT